MKNIILNINASIMYSNRVMSLLLLALLINPGHLLEVNDPQDLDLQDPTSQLASFSGPLIECSHCLNTTSTYRQCFKPCNGDYCFVQLGENIALQGCITGIPNLNNGCWRRPAPKNNGSVCLCQQQRCNSRYNIRNSAFHQNNLTCNVYDTKTDGRSIQGFCSNSHCFYRVDTLYPRTASEELLRIESGGCQEPFMRPAFYDVLGPVALQFVHDVCYTIQDARDTATTDCVCTHDSCNGPKQLTRTDKRNPLVECHMSAQGGEPSDHVHSTCLGDFCFLQRATMSGGKPKQIYSFRKGCFNVSTDQDPFVMPGWRRFDQGRVSEDLWLCNETLCNFDMASAKSASQKYQQPVAIPPPQHKQSIPANKFHVLPPGIPDNIVDDVAQADVQNDANEKLVNRLQMEEGLQVLKNVEDLGVNEFDKIERDLESETTSPPTSDFFTIKLNQPQSQSNDSARKTHDIFVIAVFITVTFLFQCLL